MGAGLRKLYAADEMLRPDQRQGELPSTRELYRDAGEIALPAVIDTVLVAMVSMMDTMMVSSLGAAAIAAVGITNQPKMIILATFMALNVGVTAVVARRRGQEDREGANKVLGQSLSLCAILSVILSVLGAVYARPLLLFAGAQADMIEAATVYFQILMIGIPCSAITLCINGAQRGCGNTRISMKINLTANAVNIVFNYLLIGGNLGFPRLEVAGAAIATVFGNVVGLLMAFYSLRGSHEHFLRIELHNLLSIDRRTVAPVVSVGLSAGVEQVFMRIGFFLYIKIIASLGTTEMATHNICQSVLNLAFSFCDGLGVAAASLSGQSLGRKRSDLAILYGKACQRISLVISAILASTFIFFGRYIIMAFSTEEVIVHLGTQVLMIIAVTTPFQAAQCIFASCLRGGGDTRYTAMVAMISIGIFRPLIAWLLCYPAGGGLVGAWCSYFIDQFVRFSLVGIRFAKGRWCQMKL